MTASTPAVAIWPRASAYERMSPLPTIGMPGWSEAVESATLEEHPRQWLGTQWPGLSLGVPSRPEESRQTRPEEVQEPSAGTGKGGT